MVMNTVQIVSGSKRIDYVDHLKGFAILLVVMSHVIGKTLGYDHIFLLNVITSFYMPLFMFLSGLCCRKKNNLLYNIIKKMKRLLVPFVLFGLLRCFFINENWIHLFDTELKVGYWFLFVLFVIFVIYYFLQGIFILLKIKNFKTEIIAYFITFIMLYGLKYILPSMVSSYLSMGLIAGMFPFFVLGVLVAQYEKMMHLITNDKMYTLSLFLAVICFYYFYYVSSSMLFLVPLKFCMVIVVFNFFRLNSDKWIIGKYLQFWGSKSLNIYVIHYYFLLYIPFWGNWIQVENNQLYTPLLFVAVLFLSVIIIVCTLILDKILCTSSFINKYIL